MIENNINSDFDSNILMKIDLEIYNKETVDYLNRVTDDSQIGVSDAIRSILEDIATKETSFDFKEVKKLRGRDILLPHHLQVRHSIIPST